MTAGDFYNQSRFSDLPEVCGIGIALAMCKSMHSDVENAHCVFQNGSPIGLWKHFSQALCRLVKPGPIIVSVDKQHAIF